VAQEVARILFIAVMDYATWTVDHLKKELCLRGARVCGRKTDLIERLVHV
jgi:hypothetical protein